MAARQFPKSLLRRYSTLVALFILACIEVACRQENPHYVKHHLRARDAHAALPIIALQLPAPDTLGDPLHPSRDSATIVWLQRASHPASIQPEKVPLFHIYSLARHLYFTVYYPRPSGLYRADSSFTAAINITDTSSGLIKMVFGLTPYYYSRSTGQWFSGNPTTQLPQVPPILALNRSTAHYLNAAKRTDTNTLVRFGDAVMHRIYHYGDNWYLAAYTKLGADISLLRKSPYQRGTRFDYANLDEQRITFGIALRPLMKDKRSPDESFRQRMHYFVVSPKNDTVYRFNLGTGALEKAIKVRKGWLYNYAYYDSVFTPVSLG